MTDHAQQPAHREQAAGRLRRRRWLLFGAVAAAWLMVLWEVLLLALGLGGVGAPPPRLLPALALAGAGLWTLPALGVGALQGWLVLPWLSRLARRRRHGRRGPAAARRDPPGRHGDGRRLVLAGPLLGLALGLELIGVALVPGPSLALASCAGVVLLMLTQGAMALLRPSRALGEEPRGVLIGGGLLLGLAPLLALGLASDGELRRALTYRTFIGGAGLGLLRTLSDLDLDGYPALLGADCSPLDGSRHPGAPDLPGNGVDEDCRDGDALPRPVTAPRGAPPPPGRLRGRNVVLITVAGLPAGQLGVLGASRLATPALDLLASRAVLFERAYPQSTLCATSLASLLKGRTPPQLRLGQVELPGGERVPGAPLFDPAPGLARLLARHDYLTMAVVSAPANAPGTGLLDGFNLVEDGPWRERDGTGGVVAGDRVVGAAEELLGATRGRTFLLWVHLADAERPQQLQGGTPWFGDRAVDRRDGALAFADAQVGRLLGRLDRSGLLGETLVLVAADHGREAAGWRGDGLPESLVRVPLFVLLPGGEARRIAAPVENVDLLPTVLELLGLPPPEGLAGQSLVPLLEGARPGRARPEAVVEVWTAERSLRALLAPPFKLVVDERLGVNSLFDLDRDPDESWNRAAQEPATLRRLQARLARWDLQGPPPVP